MKISKKFIIALTACVLLTNMSSCNDNTPTSSVTSSDLNVQAEEKTRQSNLKKYSVYSQYQNYINYDLYNAMVLYFTTMGVTQNKLIADDITLVFTPFDNTKLDAIFTTEPMTEMDNIIKDTSAQITLISNTLSEITTYYTNKTYATDNYAKGKELHNTLLTQAKSYDTLFLNFTTAFTPFKTQVETDQLEYYTDNTMPLSYASMQLLVSVEAFDNAIVKSGHNSSNLETTDITLVKPIYDTIVKYCDDIKLNISHYKDENFTSDYNTQCITLVDKVMQSTQEIMDRITAKKPLPEGTTISKTVPGTLEKLREDRNNFCVLFNT